MDALFRVPAPANEPVLGYAPGSSERATLEGELARIGGEQIDLPSTIGGRKVMGGGRTGKVVQPHAHRKVLGTMKLVTPTEAQSAIDAAKAAAPMWRDMPFADRAAIPSAAMQPAHPSSANRQPHLPLSIRSSERHRRRDRRRC